MLLAVTRSTSVKTTFVCTVTGKKYYIRGNFACNSANVIYLVECINCKCQCVGSATSFKQRFRSHKSDIKTKKDRCGTARQFNSICCYPINHHGYLKVQLIEQVLCNASKDIKKYGSVKNTGNVNYLLTRMI